MRAISLLMALAGLALPAFPALAASTPTARVSADLPVHAGPGYGYAVIGELAINENVTLLECTPSGRWCYVGGPGPQGWVLASYLVGWSAKMRVTPPKPMFTPFGLFGEGHRHRRDW